MIKVSSADIFPKDFLQGEDQKIGGLFAESVQEVYNLERDRVEVIDGAEPKNFLHSELCEG